MIDLPKRSDPIYKEIEEFEDYELTQCVAYEMAIRTPAIRKILKEKLYEDGTENSKKGILYPTETNKKIWETFKEHGLELSEVLSKKYGNNRGEIQSFFVQYTNNGLHKISANYAKDGINGITINGANPFPKPNGEDNFAKIPECNLLMTRPLLKLKTANRIMLDINFSLPLKEIEAQVAHIKDKLGNNNQAVVSPLDVFNDIAYAETDKLSKKLVAEMFFVYDYITALLDEKKVINDEITKNYNDEVNAIKENQYITWSDKQTQIKGLYKDLQGNLNKTTIKEIFNNKKTLKDTRLTEATIKRRYYDIQPFIEKLIYKELITGLEQTH